MNKFSVIFLLVFLNCGEIHKFDLVINNVTIIDGTGSSAQTIASVYVKDDKIIRITSSPIASDAVNSIDGTNKYLMPGLIDAHTHPSPFEENSTRFIRFGVTSIFVPGCGTCSNENYAKMRAIGKSDSIPAPRVFHTSQHFTIEGRHPVKTYSSSNWVEGETVYYIRDTLQIEALVEEVAQQPILGIKVTIEDGPEPPFVERIPVEFVAKIVKEAHRNNLKVFAHVDDIEEVTIAQKAGVDHIIHFVGVDIDWQKDAEVIDDLLARDISWVTTLMIDKSFFYPVHPVWLDSVEALNIFDQEMIDELKMSSSVEESIDFLSEAYGIKEPTLPGVLKPQLEDLKRLHEKGCNLIIGTDTGNTFIFPGLSMHEEMEIMASGGFKPIEIIKMATHNAAQMLDALDEIGTIEVGKKADMVLLDQNPIEDIRNTRAINTVIKNGRIQYSTNK